MKSRNWIIGCLISFLIPSVAMFLLVYKVDPYFHFHAPDTETYYYELNNHRSQNDGILRHFDYDALITGTSMTNRFKTTEADKYLNHSFVKVPFNGGTYKEVNDNIVNAIKYNPNLKLVIRALDMNMFGQDKDAMRFELGEYPTYLYNANPFDDVNYFLNREIAFGLAYDMYSDSKREDFDPGITPFDKYSNPAESEKIGIDEIIPDKQVFIADAGEEKTLTQAEKEAVIENASQNLVSVAVAHPEVDFYYFYTPYSIAYWNNLRINGELKKQIEKEKIITELLIPYKNIHLFSFNLRTDITTDLNNYTDTIHYEGWINSLMLKYMSEGEYRLTEDNYLDYYNGELKFYSNYDYSSLLEQDDYADNLYAGALTNHELTGAEPCLLTNDEPVQSMNIQIDDEYNYLVFFSRGDTTINIYDSESNVVLSKDIAALTNDDLERHTLDISGVAGDIRIDSLENHYGLSIY